MFIVLSKLAEFHNAMFKIFCLNMKMAVIIRGCWLFLHYLIKREEV